MSLNIFNYSKEKIFEQIFLRDNPAKFFFFSLSKVVTLIILKYLHIEK